MVIRIVKGKGQKDRYVPLSPMMFATIRIVFLKNMTLEIIFFKAEKRENQFLELLLIALLEMQVLFLIPKKTITPHTF